MSATFTPLVPPALPAPPPGTAPLRTKVLSPPAPPPIFRPIQYTASTPRHAPAPSPAPVSTPDTLSDATPENTPSPAPAVTPTPTQTLPTPTVSYTQENGQITRIRVQCPCGSVVELACVY